MSPGSSNIPIVCTGTVLFAFIPIHGKYPFLKEKQTTTNKAYELCVQLLLEMLAVPLLPCPVLSMDAATIHLSKEISPQNHFAGRTYPVFGVFLAHHSIYSTNG